MLSVLDGHLTGPAGAEDRGGALWATWVSSLATTPVLSKGLFTHGPCASLPAEVRQGNKLLLCWQAQNPPVPTYILWVPNQLSFRVGYTRRGKKKTITKKISASLNTITYGKYLKRNLGYYKIYFLSWFKARFSQKQFKKYRQLSLKSLWYYTQLLYGWQGMPWMT